MRMLSALLVVALASGCSAPQAHRVRRPSELAIGGSLVGVMASSLAIAALPGQKHVIIPIAIGFGGLAVVSAVVFGVAYANDPPPEPAPLPPPPPDHRAEAWALTKQAQDAARAGDCTTVATLDAQVAQIDASFHAVVFARDVAIARCLQSRH
ncbi:MAG TPA: hypothetical protein VMZ53_32745 [Kofleriaceae bacterium]|nr:hypothetical protein [Kofleriaceae bacterium]